MEEVAQRPDAGRVKGTSRRAVIDAVGGALFASLLVGVLYRLQGMPFVRNNLHALVAAIFLFLPQLFLRKRGELEAYGLPSWPARGKMREALRELGGGLARVLALVLALWPLFIVGFVLWNRTMCRAWPAIVPGSCWHLTHPSLRWPASFLSLALAQLVVVALPEELFFRGFVQGRLEDALPPTRTLLGAKVGWAVVIQAALFGLGHFLVTFDPLMLTRFFPGLVFGWLYSRTRSVIPGTVFHAACNLLVEVLASSFL